MEIVQNPLITEINNIREEQITLHYSAALAELKDKVKDEPLTTIFYLYKGCVSEKVATEIAHRLSVGDGYIATVCSGMLRSNFYLEVKLPLPSNLVHESLKETKIISEPTIVESTPQ